MLRNQVTDPLYPECPIRNVIARIGDKWSILVLLTLDEKQKPQRYGEIQHAIPDISQKMLSQTLRELEADGLLLRTAYAEVPPRVEYSLTKRARTLMPHIHNLVEWAFTHLADIVRDRSAYRRG